MLSLFSDDATLTTIRKTDDGKEQIKTYTGKEQIKNYWQAHPAFQPQNQILWGDRHGSVKVPLCQT